jgi:hypothetical protein
VVLNNCLCLAMGDVDNIETEEHRCASLNETSTQLIVTHYSLTKTSVAEPELEPEPQGATSFCWSRSHNVMRLWLQFRRLRLRLQQWNLLWLRI